MALIKILHSPQKLFQKSLPRIPPAPSCGAETRIPPNFKNTSLGFANPPSRKIVSQNRVHFALVLRASFFSFGETRALARLPAFGGREAR